MNSNGAQGNGIAIVIPYFGKKPRYINFFIESCRYNAHIDFLLFTNLKNLHVPGNVKVIPFSLRQFNELASEKLQLDIKVRHAYKLCDMKPAYGVIFAGYLSAYQFWGHGDIDVLYGRINRFLTNDILEQYDIFSVRKDYVSGSFCVYRNTDFINRLYEKSKDHQLVFQAERNYCFDECNFRFSDLEKGHSILDLRCEIESMSHVIKREELNGTVKLYFDNLIEEDVPEKLYWESGTLIDLVKNRELFMFHMIAIKYNLNYFIPTWKKMPAAFYVSSFTFIKPSFTEGILNRLLTVGCKIIFIARSIAREIKEFWGKIYYRFKPLPHEKFKPVYYISESTLSLHNVDQKLILRAQNGASIPLQAVSSRKYKGFIKHICLRVEFQLDSKKEPFMATIFSSHGLRVLGRLYETAN